MFKLIIGFFIFCIVLFIYLHVQFHLKTSDDLEIFEIDPVSKDKLEEICDLRQPLLFDIEPEHNKIILNTNKKYLLNNYPIFEIKIRDSILKQDINDNLENDTELYVPLPLQIGSKLFNDDKNGLYYSESNIDFLLETGAIKNMQQNDEYLRPFLTSNTNYDILLGSNGSITQFKYNLNYRNYYMVTQGSIQIKLTPPKYSKYLYPSNDYESFEFKSPINPWNIQPRYKNDFEKIKCLEITLVPGKCFYIPAYWWYSIKFGPDTSVSYFNYRTYMNNITIIPHICMYFLQNQNIKRKISKNIAMPEKENIEVQENVDTNLEIKLNKQNIQQIINMDIDENNNHI